MLWIFIPAGITVLTILGYLLAEWSNPMSGAGIAVFVLAFPAVLVNMIAWMIYGIAAAFFGVQ